MFRMVRLAIMVLAFAFSSATAYSLDDHEITALIQTGMDEDDIIRMLECQGSECVLTDECVQKLRQAGASDKLLECLITIIKQ